MRKTEMPTKGQTSFYVTSSTELLILPDIIYMYKLKTADLQKRRRKF